jgi:hypothetical protein
VASEDDLGALLEEELDGGDGGADAGVIGDLLGVVERDVEVGAHEHLLPLQIRLPKGTDAPLGRHITPLHAPPPSTVRLDDDDDGDSTRNQTATDPAGATGGMGRGRLTAGLEEPDRIGGRRRRRDRWTVVVVGCEWR